MFLVLNSSKNVWEIGVVIAQRKHKHSRNVVNCETWCETERLKVGRTFVFETICPVLLNTAWELMTQEKQIVYMLAYVLSILAYVCVYQVCVCVRVPAVRWGVFRCLVPSLQLHSLSAIFLREVFECTWIQTEKLSNEMSTNKTKNNKPRQSISTDIKPISQTYINTSNDTTAMTSIRFKVTGKIVWKVLKDTWSPKWHGVASYGSCAVWTVNTKTSCHKLSSHFQHSNGVLKKKNDLCWICWLRICDMFHWPCWWRCNMYHDVHCDLLMSLLGARTALKGPSWERNTTQESENHMKIMRSTRKYKEVTSPSLSHHSSLAPSSWTCFHWSLDGRERGKTKVSKEDGGYICLWGRSYRYCSEGTPNAHDEQP